MRVMLLSPPQKNIYGRLGPPYPPLGLLSIGASLGRLGHQVRFFDAAIRPRMLESALREMRPALVCITSVTPTYPEALRMADVARSVSRGAIVLGGPHVSILPEEPLRTGKAEFVVVGEGEETMVELAGALEGGDPSTVRGLGALDGSSPRYTGHRNPIEDLDSLPFPEWGLVEQTTAYVPPEALSRNVFTIMTSRGCPFACSFCVSFKLFGRKVRRRSVRNVVQEMEHLVRSRKAREFHFADDCFTSDRGWVEEFSRELKSAKLGVSLSFMNGLRADQVDRELLETLKGVGLRTAGFGVETADVGLMDRSGKKLAMPKVKEAFRACKELGINAWGFFIVGFPGEAENNARSTFEVALELAPDFAKFFPLVPFPGSRIFEEMSGRGLLEGSDWADYNLYSKRVPTLASMSPGQIAALISEFYRKYYLRPGRFLSRAIRMRSWQQFCLNLRMLMFLVDRFTSV